MNDGHLLRVLSKNVATVYSVINIIFDIKNSRLLLDYC